LTGFLLHFFVGGFGAGRFYLGLVVSAVFQLLLGIVGAFVGVCAGCCGACFRARFLSFLVVSSLSSLLALCSSGGSVIVSSLAPTLFWIAKVSYLMHGKTKYNLETKA